ncbi:hypothetical protein, partial [Mycobacterium tuberculosis]|uniref:hypothetical protein n=1 Tax=Mycobacterium tuberculosis TaxID=1773 RepID=UPI00254F648E
DMCFTLLSQVTLPLSFWDEAFSTSVYLINCLPSPLEEICPLMSIGNRTSLLVLLKAFKVG